MLVRNSTLVRREIPQCKCIRSKFFALSGPVNFPIRLAIYRRSNRTVDLSICRSVDLSICRFADLSIYRYWNNLGNKKLFSFAEKSIGSTKTVLFETQKNSLWQGYSPEFIKVKIDSTLNLKNEIKGRINFLLEQKTYKGVRHKLKYPVRGQRTRTNAKTTKKKTI